ncbi:hypothetical protein SAMN03159473_05250 [Pseudomonas sp. NFACC52]|nr:hypothetical protein SAMN03159481_04721 [Pseudomonas sp. NFACC56-3]SFL01196.1 hypothetical protein SAMN03159473_05250 [Pseudomonas sp. NFACC52]
MYQEEEKKKLPVSYVILAKLQSLSVRQMVSKELMWVVIFISALRVFDETIQMSPFFVKVLRKMFIRPVWRHRCRLG